MSIRFCDSIWRVKLDPRGGCSPGVFALYLKVCKLKMERLRARAIWQINSYTNCWRKSIGTWPGRRANRAALIAAGSCIGPIMNVKLVVARDGIDAIAFVAPHKIAGGEEHRSRCVSWDGGSTSAWW